MKICCYCVEPVTGKFTAILIVLMTILSACGSNERENNSLKKAVKTKSTPWTPGKIHVDDENFYTAYFIQGRIKSLEIKEGIPFSVHVSSINPSLAGKNIFLKILNEDEYEIRFSKNLTFIFYKGKFGEEMRKNEITLIVNREIFFDEENAELIKQVNYFFRTEPLKK